MTEIFLWLSITFYGASFISYVFSRNGSRRTMQRVSTYLLILALILHTIVLALRMMETGHAPIARRFETLLFFSWSIAILNMILLSRYRLRTTDTLTIPVIFLALLLAAFSDSGVYSLPLALKTWWFEVHVVTSFFAYALFTLAAAAGTIYLFREKTGTDAELGICQNITYRAILWGFTFFSGSMLLGAIWGYLAWGSYWLWESKSAASLLLWFYYVGVLHTRMLKGWGGKTVSVMAIAGFALVMFTYLGVSIFLKSSHGM
ncbi:MAG: cytochrome c biogenesis protein CcsA [Gammaproteobacteria bacterium]|nr:MAG: cytochrome c biogenesis protein CcsA [Gammaproteobacteria bacterium]